MLLWETNGTEAYSERKVEKLESWCWRTARAQGAFESDEMVDVWHKEKEHFLWKLKVCSWEFTSFKESRSRGFLAKCFIFQIYLNWKWFKGKSLKLDLIIKIGKITFECLKAIQSKTLRKCLRHLTILGSFESRRKEIHPKASTRVDFPH